MSLREKIFGIDDAKKELVEVKEWGISIEVRSMSALERSRLLEKVVDGKGKVNFELLYPSVVIACSFDPETGEKIFTPEDFAALNEKNAGALEHITKVALKLSGLDVDSVGESLKN